jgi:hypothetical protein
MSHEITLAAAAALTKNFRETYPARELAHSMSRDAFEELLSDPEVIGIKAYNALDTNGKYHLVFVGVKASTSYDDTDNLETIKQYTTVYPPATSEPNALNS